MWTDYNHLTVYTGGLFVPDTAYVIKIDSTVQDIDGKPIGKQAPLTFQTAPIRITQTTPQRAQIGVNPASDITLTFNTYINRTSIAPIVSLVSQAGDTVPCWCNNGYYVNNYGVDTTFTLNSILVRPSKKLARNTFYTLYLAPGAKDLNGYAMKTDYTLEFITMP
jgi:hypothetical protein